MKPLYFLPGLTEAALFPKGEVCRSLFAARGLEAVGWDVRRKREFTRCQVQAGPEGHSGLLLAFGDYGQNHEFGYHAARQRWEQVSDDLWLGIDTEQPPTPEDLQRDNLLPGHEVVLGGQAWIVPVIRGPNCSTKLPRVMKWKGGEFRLEVRAEWAKLWEQSARMWDLLVDGGTLEEAASLCIAALSANYRLDAALQSALELIDTSNWSTVLNAAVDWPAVEAFLQAQEKKSAPSQAGMASTTPGDTDAAPATDPAAENCTSPLISTETSPPSCPSPSGDDGGEA